MARKTKTKKMIELPKVNYRRDMHRQSNAVIARRVIAGEFGENWEYAVRKLGYKVKAIEVLVNGYSK